MNLCVATWIARSLLQDCDLESNPKPLLLLSGTVFLVRMVSIRTKNIHGWRAQRAMAVLGIRRNFIAVGSDLSDLNNPTRRCVEQLAKIDTTICPEAEQRLSLGNINVHE